MSVVKVFELIKEIYFYKLRGISIYDFHEICKTPYFLNSIAYNKQTVLKQNKTKKGIWYNIQNKEPEQNSCPGKRCVLSNDWLHLQSWRGLQSSTLALQCPSTTDTAGGPEQAAKAILTNF